MTLSYSAAHRTGHAFFRKAGIALHRIQFDKIRRVKYLGIRSSAETRMFYTQVFSVYSFWIEYEDGHSKTVELADTSSFSSAHAAIQKLLAIANQKNAEDPEKGKSTSSELITELKDLKEIFEAGMIPESVFEEQKSKLLGQLQTSEAHQKKQNLSVVRTNPKIFGESKTVMYLDGKKAIKNVVGKNALLLEQGNHAVYFRRALLASREIHLDLFENNAYTIEVHVGLLSIKVQVREE